jgi:hypothetical protein
MDKKRLWIQRIGALCMMLTLLVTVVSFFVVGPTAPSVDTDKNPDTPKPDVTDTVRSPWISVDKEGLVTLYPENMLGMTDLVIPDAVDGIRVTGFAKAPVEAHPRKIKSIIFPAGFSATQTFYFREWESLETVVFSEGIEDLTGLWIIGMPSLREIYIPKTLTGAFYEYSLKNCGEHVTIYYAGTEEEWASLGALAERLTELSLKNEEDKTPGDVTQDGGTQGDTPQNGTSQETPPSTDASQNDGNQTDPPVEDPPAPVWPKITIVFETPVPKTLVN